MRAARFASLCLLIVSAPTLASGGCKPADPTSQNARTNREADAPRSPKDAKPKFELKDGDRVVFLGNTLIERAQKYGYWETMLTARYPNRKIIFRNLGWDGDTVWAESRGLFDTPAKGYARMLAHVGRIKPTAIFLGYGNNEAFAGKPGLPRFIKQYNKLLDDLTKVSAKGVRFVLLSPYLYEKHLPAIHDPTVQNEKIRQYAKAIKKIALERRAVFVDLVALCERYQSGKGGRLKPIRYTENGLIFKRSFWRSVAREIGVSLFGREAFIKTIELDKNGKVLNASSDTITRAVRLKDQVGIRFQATPSSIEERVTKLLVRGYEVGDQFALYIDKKRIRYPNDTPYREPFTVRFQVKTERDKHGRIVGDGYALAILVIGPGQQSFEKLRKAIIEKNRLYFHSWRPQNVTYLFLFRKHEQGQNAKEVKQFLKLVAAKEKEIDRLKKPVTRTYELIRVKPKKEKVSRKGAKTPRKSK